MIQFLGINFSCNKCKIGHRTSNCAHWDRPLIEIPTKGRPSTQCGFCKSQRSTSVRGITKRQTSNHHKCPCGDGTFYDAEIKISVSSISEHRDILFVVRRGYPEKSKEFTDQIVPLSSHRVFGRGKDKTEIAFDVSIANVQVGDIKPTALKQQQEVNPCRCYETGQCICSQLTTSRIRSYGGRSMTLASSSAPVAPSSCRCCSEVVNLTRLLNSDLESKDCSCKNILTSSCNCLCCI